MRLVVMATGSFAVPMFQALMRSEHTVVGLVTRPDRQAEGRRVNSNPAREVAEAGGIPIQAPLRVNDAEFAAVLKGFAADLWVVCDYGQILSREVLGSARLGGINLHGSLLPAYRGAAPVQWAILQGETETGVTVIHMDPRLDAGPILAQARTPLDPEETAPELEARLAQLGAELVPQAIGRLAAWDGRGPLGHSQDGTRISRAPRLRKEDARIDWSRPAQQLHNQVRGLRPWPGTVTEFNDAKGNSHPLNIVATRIETEITTSSFPGTPGTMVASPGGGFLIATGDGVLEVLRVRPAGRAEMTGPDFLRGYRLQPGDRLK